jgi:hypothetical protein
MTETFFSHATVEVASEFVDGDDAESDAAKKGKSGA